MSIIKNRTKGKYTRDFNSGSIKPKPIKIDSKLKFGATGINCIIKTK